MNGPRLHTLSANKDDLIMVNALINNRNLKLLCDTGAQINLIPHEFALKHCGRITTYMEQKPVSVDGSEVKCTGVVHAELKVGDKIITTLFYVMKSLEYGILGMAALKQLGANIDTVTGSMFVDGMVVGNTVNADQNIVTARCYHVRLKQSTVIGPGEEKLLTGVAEISAPFTGLVEASDSFIQRTGLLAAPVQVQEGSVEFPLCVINIWDKPIRVYRCQNIAEFTETDGESSCTNSPTVATVGTKPSTETIYDPVTEAEIGDNLSQLQTSKIQELLRRNSDVFDHEGNHGLTDTIEHHIKTTKAEPINCPRRRLPKGLVNPVNYAVEDLLQRGHIEQSYSPWAFPIVPVKKKDGSIRIAIDYRPLNKISVSDQYPTAHMGECLDKLQNATFFSTVDLAQGYHQVPLRKEDREKTAFRSPNGLWQWLVMPEGLKSAPATLSRLMQRVFNHIPSERIVLYFDDVCCISQTFEEHLANLQEMFDALRRHNLKIKASKCIFGASRITFLGHQVSSNGISPPADIATKLEHWTKLQDVKDVQSFLSMCSWWRKFIKDYSTIAQPLQKLLQKGKFQWSDEAQCAFEKLKHAITHAPVKFLKRSLIVNFFLFEVQAFDCQSAVFDR